MTGNSLWCRYATYHEGPSEQEKRDEKEKWFKTQNKITMLETTTPDGRCGAK